MPLRTLLADEFRFLTFRRTSPAVVENWRAFLAFGLFFTWLAGIGRYWDNPKAHLVQHLGLGSVVYVFVLALILWLLVLPLKPRHWSYRNVLVFVTLTSPPAVLYAIPVERFVDMGTAQLANSWFLAVVAVWRIALMVAFLRRVAGLSGLAVLITGMLPITLIIVALASLNLEHVVFELMGGFSPATPNDSAYVLVLFLSIFSMATAPVLLIFYGWLVFRTYRPAKIPPPPRGDA